jgi:hypothetical protein
MSDPTHDWIFAITNKELLWGLILVGAIIAVVFLHAGAGKLATNNQQLATSYVLVQARK